MTDDAELLASAYLDGDLSEEERARVEADPDLLAEVQRLVAVREALADVEPARPDRREAHLAAALSAWEGPSPAPVVEPVEPSRAVPTPLEPARRPNVLRWTVAAAAALLVVVAAGVLVSRSDGNGEEDVATDAPAAETESAEESATEAGGVGTEAPVETAVEEMTDETEAAAQEMSEDFGAAEDEMSENTDAAEEELSEDTAAGDDMSDEAAGESDDAETTQAAETPTIVRVRAYDPDSGGTEDDPAAAALAGDDPAATWSTECSADRQPGGAQGVGLVVSFDRQTERPLIVDVESAPSQIEFYAAATRRLPTTFEQWGASIGAAVIEAQPAEVASPPYGEPVRHVLVVFDQVPPDPGCPDTEPYRGTIGDVRPAE